MKFATTKFGIIPVTAALVLTLHGCKDDETTQPSANPVELKNHSTTPALVKNVMSGVEVFSLISSDDVLPESPSFVFGGSADGAGWLKNSDGTFTFVVNHEDNFSIARVAFDKTFRPVKGEYIVTSDAGKYRLCSGTLATPEVHGFGPIFLSGGETGAESEILAVNPFGGQNSFRFLEQLGHWSTENAVPLPKDAYTGKTVILIGDDDFQGGGELAMYMSSTVGDLDNGRLFVMARTDDNTAERNMAAGQTYNVEFREIQNPKTLAPTDFNTRAVELKAIQFGRTEDIDYRKGGGANSREIYFVVTGQKFGTGPNADNSRTMYGRMYRLVLDPNDPLKGTLECVLDGDNDNGSASLFQDPDNVCVTTNYVYIQEDPNGYGDETHDAYIYQYNLASKQVKVVMELDHRRGEEKYNQAVGSNPLGQSKLGSWEYGALVDISDITGIPNTFSLCIQPHTWVGDKYKNPDGGTLRKDEKQASQVLILRGLPR